MSLAEVITGAAPWHVEAGDALTVLPSLASSSVDCVVTDPPYPCIQRSYGTWTVEEWWALMMGVCAEVRRLLRPSGSAVFVLQPNSESVGKMRGWLWEFMAWACREWNMVQDAWWWNTSALPLGGACKVGLMRPSVKACVWCGPPDCYRNQAAVLQSESPSNRRDRLAGNFGRTSEPSRRRSDTEGARDDKERLRLRCAERGGTTPFNILAMGSSSPTSGGTHGHGASTPLPLCRWWVNYLCPPGCLVLDPFAGGGTTGLAARNAGHRFLGIELNPAYAELARRRIGEAAPLLDHHDRRQAAQQAALFPPEEP